MALYLIAPGEYIEAKKFVLLLALSYVFLGGFDILHVGMANAKKFNYLLICFGASCLLNILLDILRIPRYAGLVAAANVHSFYLLMVIGNVYSPKMYFIQWRYKILATCLLMTFGIILLILVFNKTSYCSQLMVKTLAVVGYSISIWFVVIQNVERKNLLNYSFKFLRRQ